MKLRIFIAKLFLKKSELNLIKDSLDMYSYGEITMRYSLSMNKNYELCRKINEIL